VYSNRELLSVRCTDGAVDPRTPGQITRRCAVYQGQRLGRSHCGVANPTMSRLRCNVTGRCIERKGTLSEGNASTVKCKQTFLPEDRQTSAFKRRFLEPVQHLDPSSPVASCNSQIFNGPEAPRSFWSCASPNKSSPILKLVRIVGVGCGYNQRYVNSLALQLEKSRPSMQSNHWVLRFFPKGETIFFLLNKHNFL
jgi:hypothetical protein